MFKNWKTTLFGALVGISQIAPVLSTAGVSVGHWGGSDFIHVLGGVSSFLVGAYAKDNNK